MARRSTRADATDRVETKLDMFKEHFDSHMEDISGEFKEIKSRINNMDSSLMKQQVLLDESTRRTNLLELKLQEDKRSFESKIVPLNAQHTQIKLAIKILAGLLSVGGAGFGIKEIVGLIIG